MPEVERVDPEPGADAPADEHDAADDRAQGAPADRELDAPLSIVALGASAGGLEALQRFFSCVPAQIGLAFVVVTHQQVGHTSLLPELLGRHTAMPVRVATSGTRLEPDCVYVSPPGVNLALTGRTLHVLEPEQGGSRFPIDSFFTSLAREHGAWAIGIILSGTGSDGTAGLKEIKAAAGMVMVQEERSAQHAGMLQSAIATELVDYVLSVDDMPRRLVLHRGAPDSRLSTPAREPAESMETRQQIYVLLRDHTGHDFSNYKVSTVLRRIESRMGAHQIANVRSYVRYLQTHEAELDLLFKELLIGVTSFFRDPEAFAALGEALPELLESGSEREDFRVWVPGCSTGEEAYSLAVLIRECLERTQQRRKVKIFATDLNETALQVARAGRYPDDIARDVSPERLERLFRRTEGGGYCAKKEVREMLVFAPQNLISDPPFTKLDLLSCRNLLIYLNGELQRRLLSTFHYALRQGGLLFLGSSEATGLSARTFEAVHKGAKVYRRREVPPSYQPEVSSVLARVPRVSRPRSAGPRPTSASRLAEKLLLRKLVPPSVLMHEGGEVVHIHGRTGRFLEPAPGPQTRVNLFAMAREGLRAHLAAAIREASERPGEVVVRRGIRVKTESGRARLDLEVQQLSHPDSFQGLFLVSFERPRALASPAAEPEEPRPTGRVVELQQELQLTLDGHQRTVEELETTNEELQSANEELQSANEELKTSQEELQSLNEELRTVNSELYDKVEELSGVTDDMSNLLNGTAIATVFLDNDLKIKRFTAEAQQVIRLAPSDVGRSIGDLVTRIHYQALEEDAREVLRTLSFKEVEVRGERGWYLLRILPYRTGENLIDGVVITFLDVSTLRDLRERNDRVQHALRGSATGVCGQDRDLRYSWVCSSGLLGLLPEAVVGRTDAELLPAAEAAELDVLKRRVLESGIPAREELELSIGGGRRLVGLHVTAVSDAKQVTGIACVYTDLVSRAPDGGPR